MYEVNSDLWHDNPQVMQLRHLPQEDCILCDPLYKNPYDRESLVSEFALLPQLNRPAKLAHTGPTIFPDRTQVGGLHCCIRRRASRCEII